MAQDAGGRVIIFQDNGLGVLQNVGAPDPLVRSSACGTKHLLFQGSLEWVDENGLFLGRGAGKGKWVKWKFGVGLPPKGGGLIQSSTFSKLITKRERRYNSICLSVNPT